MAISTRQVKNKRDSNGILTGRPGTVYDVNIKYIAPDGKKKTHGVLARYDADTFTLVTEGKKPAEITISRNNKATVQPYIRF